MVCLGLKPGAAGWQAPLYRLFTDLGCKTCDVTGVEDQSNKSNNCRGHSDRLSDSIIQHFCSIVFFFFFVLFVQLKQKTKAAAEEEDHLDGLMLDCVTNAKQLWALNYESDFHDCISTYRCDQIGRFIALWATFLSLWQQLFCPNRPHFWAYLVKVWKSFIFPVK